MFSSEYWELLRTAFLFLRTTLVAAFEHHKSQFLIFEIHIIHIIQAASLVEVYMKSTRIVEHTWREEHH